MSRSTSINEMSRSVTGTYVLRDLLSITTMSGNINVTIVPQPASSSGAPAELRLNTSSGSINVTMGSFLHDPTIPMHDRVFNTSLKSMSGDIHAAIVHNHQTSISTMSGSITASIYPLGQPSSMSYLDCSCHSGSASVLLHPYYNCPQASIRALSMDFRGGSGRLEVRVPSTWEGEVISHLTSGSLKYDWAGLQFLTQGPNFTAKKGDGAGQLKIWGASMNVELVGQHMRGPPSFSIDEEPVKEEGDRGLFIPGLPGRSREVGAQQQGQQVPSRSMQDERRDTDENDDDWTVVGDEDGGEQVVKRPPPSYEAAMRG